MNKLRLDINDLCIETFKSPRYAGLAMAPPNDASPDGATEGSTGAGGGNCCCA